MNDEENVFGIIEGFLIRIIFFFANDFVNRFITVRRSK